MEGECAPRSSTQNDAPVTSGEQHRTAHIAWVHGDLDAARLRFEEDVGQFRLLGEGRVLQSRRCIVGVAFAAVLLLVAGVVGVVAVGSDAPTPVSRAGLRRTPTSAAAANGTNVPSAPAPPSTVASMDQETLPAAVVFIGPLTGFAATSRQTGLFSDTATTAPLVGQILRTSDGGRSWQPVWVQPATQLDAITFEAGRLIVVGTGVSNNGEADGAVMVTSDDFGASWSVAHPVIPGSVTNGDGVGPFAGLRLHFATPQIGFAVPAPQSFPGASRPLWTTDGGQHWNLFKLPGGIPSGVATATSGSFFATGSTSACEGELWVSQDLGKNWTAVPGTCEAFLLDAMTFPTTQLGVAVGGTPIDAATFPARAVLRTTDGGTIWTKAWLNGSPVADNGGQPFSSVAFVNGSIGYALAGACKLSQNSPCDGDLWRTTDGGATWMVLPQNGYQLQLLGPDDVWLLAGEPGALNDYVQRSTDGARSFSAFSLSS